ncbi:MAG: ABC transporter permease, partial [Nitrososphaerales archaeon]
LRMGNLWKVSVAEYTRLAHKRSFLLSLVGMPLFIGVVVAIAILTAMPKGDARPLGYVDLAGVTQGPAVSTDTASESPVGIQGFASEDAARAALRAGEIQAYYLIPADYLTSRQVTLYTWGKPPAGAARSVFQDFLTAHLVAQAPAEAQKVLLDGIKLNYRAANDAREMPQEGFIVSTILPFVVGFFFVMVVMSSGGYLLQAVTTEKENRMVEVMMTSVSPLQLIGGKALGLIGVALTQVGVWLVALGIALVWGAAQVPWLRQVEVPGTTIALAALWFLPTYVLLAGLMITVGSIVTELQHGQQIAGAFNLLFAVPFFFLVLIFTSPDSPIMVLLTLFPTTSMMTIAMRWGVTAIPAWQLLLSYGLLVAAAIASIWMAARVFRLGMLRYGQPLSLAGLLELLRPNHQAAAAAGTGRMAS